MKRRLQYTFAALIILLGVAMIIYSISVQPNYTSDPTVQNSRQHEGVHLGELRSLL